MKKKKSLFPKVLLLFAVCLFIFVFLGKYNELKSYREEIDSLNAQISEQEEYGKELDKTSKQSETDEFAEEYARSLGFVKPNEKIFRNYNDKK